VKSLYTGALILNLLVEGLAAMLLTGVPQPVNAPRR